MNIMFPTRSISNIYLTTNKEKILCFQKQRQKSQHLSQQGSYSILQFQMEKDKKICIKTKRKMIRSFSAYKQTDRQTIQQQNNNSQLLYSPPKVPSPKHFTMLQKKTTMTKFPHNVRKSQQYLLNDILSNKPINQPVLKRTSQQKQTGQFKQQKASPLLTTYPLLFGEIQRDPLKYQVQAQKFSILLNQNFIRKLHDQRQ